jgi:anti-sigma B factor antagonist
VTAAAPAAAPERMLSVSALPSTCPGRVVVEVVGEVDTFTAPLLDACLHSQAARPGTSDLIVDLRWASFLGGAGVRAVADAERLCRRRNARLSVRCRPGMVQRTLELAGLGGLHGSAAVPERTAR